MFDALTAPPAADPWQTGTQVFDVYYEQSPAGGTAFTAPLRLSTASSNPEASGYNNLQEQFLGDYIGLVAGPTGAVAVWTDVRNGTLCPAVSAYRAQVYAGTKTAVAPNPDTACPAGFGETDTYAGLIGY